MGYRGNTPLDYDREYPSSYERDKSEYDYRKQNEVHGEVGGGIFLVIIIGGIYLLIKYIFEVIADWFSRNEWVLYTAAWIAGCYFIFRILRWMTKRGAEINRLNQEERERKILYDKYMREAKDKY